MAYVTIEPSKTIKLAVTPTQILENFAQLNTQFAIDHAQLIANGTDYETTGKHLKVTLPVRADPTAPAKDTAIVYTKTSGATAHLYMRNSVHIVEITQQGGAAGLTKAFCSFNSAGAIVGSAYNISGVVRNSTGVYTITLNPAFTDAKYTAICTADAPAIPNSMVEINIVSKTASTMKINAWLTQEAGGTLIDIACNIWILRV